MESLITKYSIEGRDLKTGRPNGQFFVTKDYAAKVADEVVETHLKFKGKKKTDYLKQNFN